MARKPEPGTRPETPPRLLAAVVYVTTLLAPRYRMVHQQLWGTSRDLGPGILTGLTAALGSELKSKPAMYSLSYERHELTLSFCF